MTRERYEKIEKELDRIDDYIAALGKKYGEFILDGKYYCSYEKEIGDIGDEGETIFMGSAFCPDKIEINEEYEDQIEYLIPSYNYVMDRFGKITSCHFDVNYDWKNEFIGYKLGSYERRV